MTLSLAHLIVDTLILFVLLYETRIVVLERRDRLAAEKKSEEKGGS